MSDMIHWLVQSLESYPTRSNGVVILDGILHSREQTRFTTLKTEKRRRDWLLGRWTAKQLVGRVIADQTGAKVPLDTIEIHSGVMGDPIVNCQLSMVNRQLLTDSSRASISNLQALVTLSISHSHSHAFCALVERADWPLGADIEQVVPRADEFVTDYFTEDEQALVAQAVDGMRSVAVTAVWSAKEAVLKALHLGLTVDTRSVACLIEPVTERPLTWTPFTVQCDGSRLSQTPPPLGGWWRTYKDFVLTLVTET
ncbi:MAG: phosphopantetheinyl transferase [Chloroflexi bacterium]|nr:MAG: phosphopantetheinyl transferase [Chloroflexota bacterium]